MSPCLSATEKAQVTAPTLTNRLSPFNFLAKYILLLVSSQQKFFPLLLDITFSLVKNQSRLVLMRKEKFAQVD